MVMEGSVASCCGAAGSDVVRSWRGEDPHWDRQPYNCGRRQCIWGRQRCMGVCSGSLGQATVRLGQATVRLGQATGHWGRQRVIGACNGAFGVGNGSLGQVNNLPQCGLTCPNAANVPQCDSRRPGGRGARDGVCFHSDASGFTAVPHFASVITLAKWRHPFENSASLAKQPTASTRRARLPFESTASPAKRPRPCPDRRTFQCETPPRWDGRPYSRGSAPRSCSYPPGVTGWPPL